MIFTYYFLIGVVLFFLFHYMKKKKEYFQDDMLFGPQTIIVWPVTLITIFFDFLGGRL